MWIGMWLCTQNQSQNSCSFLFVVNDLIWVLCFHCRWYSNVGRLSLVQHKNLFFCFFFIVWEAASSKTKDCSKLRYLGNPASEHRLVAPNDRSVIWCVPNFRIGSVCWTPQQRGDNKTEAYGMVLLAPSTAIVNENPKITILTCTKLMRTDPDSLLKRVGVFKSEFIPVWILLFMTHESFSN